MFKKIAIISSTLVLLASWVYARGAIYPEARMAREEVPQPVLITPKTDIVHLAGLKELVFKWSPHEQARPFRRYYDFRLYKGRVTLESTLIFKKQVPPDQWELALPSDMFENNQAYTWTMRQVYDEGRKSRFSYQAFTVIK